LIVVYLVQIEVKSTLVLLLSGHPFCIENVALLIKEVASIEGNPESCPDIVVFPLIRSLPTKATLL
jgi:hypothetical protein